MAENQAVVDTSPRSSSSLAVPSQLGSGLAPPGSAPPPSLRLGDYELLERVGAGGMAEVWMARRAVIPGGLQACALKIIHGRFSNDHRYQRMFLQEARLALKLRHANVVSVLDAGEAEGRLYMALEWVDGVHLRCFTDLARTRLGPLPVPLVCHVVGELLQGLRHAHRLRVGDLPLGVVHRDVAPHNVLVSSAGEVKLADFGIARVLGEESSGEHVKGRARYMAPEQLHGEPTQASDLFAVGGILHELLDGRRFREGLEQRTDWHRVVAEAPLPTLHRPVPAPLEALRVALLQPDPERRIASADEALGWLLRCPPWPAGATALRQLYARCVGMTRRTGLTDSELLRHVLQGSERSPVASPAPPSSPAPWVTAVSPAPPSSPAPRVTAGSPSSPAPWVAAIPASPSSSPSAPVPVIPAPGLASRVELTATLRPRDRAASWTPTPSRSTPGGSPSEGCEAVVIRRRSAPRPFRPPVRPGSWTSRAGNYEGAAKTTLRRLSRGLWLLAAGLAVVATGLAVAPGRPRPLPACIHEAPVEPAAWARLRLRGDGQPLAQVRIDMQTLEVGSHGECVLSPGLHDLAWRPSGAEPWRPAGSHTLDSEKEHLVRVGEDGMAITAYDP